MAKPWKGAELISHQEFRYGAFEARLRSAPGDGVITPFFLWKEGSHLAGTAWQEQDFEFFGADCKFQMQIMTPGIDGAARTQNVEYGEVPFGIDACSEYHTYRMEWTPDYLAFYVDGIEVRRETDQVRYRKHLDPAQAEAAQVRLGVWVSAIDFGGGSPDSATAAYVNWVKFYAFVPNAQNEDPFSLVLHDDFDSLDLDRWHRANWTFDSAASDYVKQHAQVIDGTLVLALTDEASVGQIPTPPNDPGTALASTIPASEGSQAGPALLPARLAGSETARFGDRTSGDKGGCQAETDLDTQTTTDDGPSCAVAFVEPQEWLEWDVEVPEDAAFDLVSRVATPRTGRSFVILVDDELVGDALSAPASNWQSYTDVVAPNVFLTQGAHRIRVAFANANLNFNYLDVRLSSGSSSGITNLPAALALTDYAHAGESTSGNQGDASCLSGNVDARLFPGAVGTGCAIGWTDRDEWLEYNVQVLQQAEYALELDLASGLTNTSVHLEIDGIDVTGPIAVSKTGWSNYNTFTLPGRVLASGVHRVRIVFDTGYVNLSRLEFLQIDITQPNNSACVTNVYEAETMFASAGGPTPSGWNLWSNGELATVHHFTGGPARVIVRARGEAAANVWPIMRLQVGAATTTKNVEASEWTDYSFELQPPTEDAVVGVEFTNDYYAGGEDRNLLVDSVTILETVGTDAEELNCESSSSNE